MGMIKCPDCGKEISEAATSCIGCGRPMHSGLPALGKSIDSTIYSLVVFIAGGLWAYLGTKFLLDQPGGANPIVLLIIFALLALPLWFSLRMAKKSLAKLLESNHSAAIPTIVKIGSYIGLGILSALFLVLIGQWLWIWSGYYIMLGLSKL